MTVIEEITIGQVSQPTRLQDIDLDQLSYIATKSALKKAIKRGQILLNGHEASTASWIETGMKLSFLQLNKPNQPVFKLDLNVVYEDEVLAVVNKPPGYPTSGHFFRTIEHCLPHNLSRSNQPDALSHFQPVHRLDNPTQGLLLVAKTSRSKSMLTQAFQEQAIHKAYRAICYGEFQANYKHITTPIDGQEAQTEVFKEQVIRRKNQEVFTLVRLKPKTGRTHQLRRHLQLVGHPIVGDSIYASHVEALTAHKGLFLQAFQLGFKHPEEQEIKVFRLELPKKFIKFIETNSDH